MFFSNVDKVNFGQRFLTTKSVTRKTARPIHEEPPDWLLCEFLSTGFQLVERNQLHSFMSVIFMKFDKHDFEYRYLNQFTIFYQKAFRFEKLSTYSI